MNVFVVTFEWDVDGSTEFEIVGVYQDRKDAVAKLKEERDKTMNDYTNGMDSFDVETDKDDLFQYQQNQWDKYYIISIEEHKVQ